MAFKYDLGERMTLPRYIESLENGLLAAELRAQYQRDGKMGMMPEFIVTERNLQECPGGTQLTYLCRYWKGNGYGVDRFHEFELVPFPVEKSHLLLINILTETPSK